MISFDEAFDITRAAARPLGTERVALNAAAGRFLSNPVEARIDGPRADVSTMDGYAVRDADLADLPRRLPIIGEAFPGGPFPQPLEAGTCIRIFTGAPIPEGSDRVVIQEVVERNGNEATFARQLPSPRFIRRRGSDFEKGDILVDAGRRLDARALVAAAAGNVDEVNVFRRPRVAIVATGNELCLPGKAAGRGFTIPESISPGLAEFASQCGAEVVDTRLLADDLKTMRESIRECLSIADVIVVTGGASVGERDFAKLMFEELDLLFSKVAIKPGKPVWLGRAGGRLVMGLPGNPTSALVTARIFLTPLLVGIGGGEPAATVRWRKAALATPLEACGDRETFWRARDLDGRVAIISNQDSGAQRMLVEADLLVRQPIGAPALGPGDEVPVISF